MFRLVPVTKANDLAQVYDEKLRLLRKLKPELFDNQGNLISHNVARSNSHRQSSIPSSKKYFVFKIIFDFIYMLIFLIQ